MGGKNKSEGVEDLIEESFLVDTTTIASRKTSLIGDGSGRIRDHKLQVCLFNLSIGHHFVLFVIPYFSNSF